MSSPFYETNGGHSQLLKFKAFREFTILPLTVVSVNSFKIVLGEVYLNIQNWTTIPVTTRDVASRDEYYARSLKNYLLGLYKFQKNFNFPFFPPIKGGDFGVFTPAIYYSRHPTLSFKILYESSNISPLTLGLNKIVLKFDCADCGTFVSHMFLCLNKKKIKFSIKKYDLNLFTGQSFWSSL